MTVLRTRRKWFAPAATVLLIFTLSACTKQSTPSINDREDEVVSNDSSQNVPQIVFFGDSITAGYGLRSKDEAFPAIIQKRLDDEGFSYEVINAGESGETSSGGLRRVEWIMSRSPDAEIFVLELGGNDGLRGIPTELTKRNLSEIIDKVRSAKPGITIIVAGMQIPSNMGSDYVRKFAAIFPDVAREKNAELIPFVLKDVGGIRSLNQVDGIHPTSDGHKIIAKTVWETLGKTLKSELVAN